MGDIESCIEGIDRNMLKLCSELMQDLNIEWCGSLDPAYFNLIATEQQIMEIIQRLEKPIIEWRYKEERLENDYS